MTEILQIQHKMPNNRSYCKVCFHCHLTVGICSFLCNFGCNVFSQCLLNKTDLVFCFDLNLCLKSFLIIIVNFYIYLLITSKRSIYLYKYMTVFIVDLIGHSCKMIWKWLHSQNIFYSLFQRCCILTKLYPRVNHAVLCEVTYEVPEHS